MTKVVKLMIIIILRREFFIVLGMTFLQKSQRRAARRAGLRPAAPPCKVFSRRNYYKAAQPDDQLRRYMSCYVPGLLQTSVAVLVFLARTAGTGIVASDFRTDLDRSRTLLFALRSRSRLALGVIAWRGSL